jgi:hypothetical protein
MHTINGQSVEIAVVAPDGSDGGQPSDNEIQAISTIDVALKADEQFTTTYPNKKLERVESMRGIADSEEGRYYLRYQDGVEFWGHIGKAQHINFKKGIISVLP